MANLRNPFIIGKYVSSDYFCDRRQETDTLYHHLSNGRNVALMSERRLGKTGLIEHTFATRMDAEYFTFMIDIYTCKNLREMVCMLANEVFKVFARRQSITDRLLQFIHSLSASVSYNAITGEPEIGLKLGEIKQPEATLDDLLSYLEMADKPCIVGIDEFQRITEFDEKNMEELLRTKIQHLRNTQIVFAGSERHLLEGIFNDPERPFYNSVVFMQLQPIDKQEYVKFSQRLFAEHGKNVEGELVEHLYEYFKGVTWYLQLSMNEAFTLANRGETLTDDAFQAILTHMVDTKRYTFEDRYASLTEKQKAVLMAIATEYPDIPTPTSQNFITKHSLKTASSVQTAMKGLTDKKILQEQHGRRIVTDILFILWLKNY